MIEYLLLLNFYKYIDILDFNSLCSINRNLYKYYINNESIWKYYSIHKFSQEYWEKASLQPRIPWKDALINIINFENKVIKIGSPLWKEEDYFFFWKVKGWL